MIVNAESRIAELTATCKEQGQRIAELRENLRFAGEVVKATKSMAETCLEERKMGNGGCGACSICCGEYRAELAKLRESKDLCPICLTWSWAPCDEGVLCQCCNDSRIAVLWKGRAEELREAGQAVVGMWDGKDGACVEIRVIEALRAALAKGDEK